MIKSELIAKLAEDNPHLTQRDIERVVNVILERMIVALEEGGRVELRGFGAPGRTFASKVSLRAMDYLALATMLAVSIGIIAFS